MELFEEEDKNDTLTEIQSTSSKTLHGNKIAIFIYTIYTEALNCSSETQAP
ncbi:hypothetical protein Cal6303_2441 [Calothrix sp. PCC 6303]|nr:hypothetical protein Cal6303_2441 [Calothrix sp. PCC 6303]